MQQPPNPYPQHQWYQQPPKGPKREWYQRLFAWCRLHPIKTAAIFVVILVLLSAISGRTTSHPSTDTQTVQDAQSTSTQAPDQATDTTIADLDKDGSADQGKYVHFSCTIVNFVKDSNGNTAGANVNDTNTSAIVQIAFPPNTDLSRLNTGDTLQVWGTDEGAQSGQNAFGATIQEVVVSANDMNDMTTDYQTNG
jgi:hypothetical protein